LPRPVRAGIRRRRHAATGIEASAVLQFKLAIETEEVRRTDGAIATSHFLRRVVQIGKGESELSRHAHHVVERILRVLGRIVAHDRRHADAQRLQFARVATDAVDDRLDIGAMVADEHQQQTVRAAQGGQGLARTAGIGQLEVCGSPAELAHRGIERHAPPNSEHRLRKNL